MELLTNLWKIFSLVDLDCGFKYFIIPGSGNDPFLFFFQMGGIDLPLETG